MNKSWWQCVGEVHSCRALCGKSGLYVSLAEYLNSCIGSESSERSCFHFSPLLFSVVSWSSPTHLLFPPLGKVVSTYSIFGVEYRLCFISLFCSILVLLKIQTQIFIYLRYNHLAIHDVGLHSHSRCLGLTSVFTDRYSITLKLIFFFFFFWSQGSKVYVLLWYIYCKYLMSRRLLDLLELTQQTVPCCLWVAGKAFLPKLKTHLQHRWCGDTMSGIIASSETFYAMQFLCLHIVYWGHIQKHVAIA